MAFALAPDRLTKMDSQRDLGGFMRWLLRLQGLALFALAFAPARSQCVELPDEIRRPSGQNQDVSPANGFPAGFNVTIPQIEVRAGPVLIGSCADGML